MAKQKSAVAKTIDKTPKIVKDAVDKITDRAEKLKETISKRAEDAATGTQRRATKVMLSVIDFQKTTFDNTFKIIGQVQEQSEKAIQNLIEDASWLPKEGKAIIKEWIRMLRVGRSDFQKTVDKSFDLVTDYFERVVKAEEAPKPVVAKKSTAKKRPAKKKSAAKKKAGA
ncbi:MAG TPA: hypothetical protein PKI11_06660 [Candidatus Hydrogenedentes bacterium]|nr:hypothetical protein [Candidatus Hydrogenedentota bacterium]HNT87481.1 hypothetical protein [Candidatus Hydrogenedentota bacterium]